ncbi:MAG: MMPL family transporter, partial [Oscillospiraceae bacterium]|jgi:predicted RND superfamily exporter protein|nr:MMPL family transporter [Oscillospiraceae bacterium]
LQGYGIYYLALLIVQSILMGATIDYGILFTDYYRERRQSMDIKAALVSAYSGSIHTILTSGLIMVLVTGIVGFCFEDPVVGQICRTIAIGALSAILLILLVLPGMLATFDRGVAGNRRKRKTE